VHDDLNSVEGERDTLVGLVQERYGYARERAEAEPVHVYMHVPDADATFKQATAAGAKAMMAMMDAFWGDRWGEASTTKHQRRI
jgi:uncharacterized glyoxalase superfamily protein PhnB